MKPELHCTRGLFLNDHASWEERKQPGSCEMEVGWWVHALQVEAGGGEGCDARVCSSSWLPVRRRRIFGSETTTWTDTVLPRV